MLEYILTIVISVITCAVLTGIEIPVLKEKQFGQYIREEGPESHQKKSGTPTMGGVAIYASIAICSFIAGLIKPGSMRDIMVITVTGLAFGMIGFIDDYIKVAKKHNLGLTAVQKLVLQVLFSVVFAVYIMKFSEAGSMIWVPFIGKEIDLGMLFVPFVAFAMVAMANSVNLTDGLDGLCAGVTGIVSLAFVLILIGAAGAGIPGFRMAGNAFGASSYYLTIMGGACIGFLLWNWNPAKIFMGDTGSMALGAGLTAAVCMVRMELLIPVIGLIYVLEALSVIIQVLYFKATGGKRFFRMAPLHHHFELGGMAEKNVVRMFYAFAVICGIAAFLITSIG